MEEVTQISTACRKIRKKGHTSVRELARLIGKMTATLPAVFPAPLWYQELQCLKNFRVHGDTESGGPPGARLVVSREELNGQEECNNTGPRPHHGDRCLNAGLGSSLPGLMDWRTLVSDGPEEPH